MESEYKKQKRIDRWKRQGIASDDWDATHKLYMETKQCNSCGVTFYKKNHSPADVRRGYRVGVRVRVGRNKCLDHDHWTGDVRQILCNNCNIFDRWAKKDDIVKELMNVMVSEVESRLMTKESIIEELMNDMVSEVENRANSLAHSVARLYKVH